MTNIILPKRIQYSHKNTYGKVLNIAGSQNYIGAAYLSSISALKVGAGYVTLASTPNVLSSISMMTPDIVFVPIKKLKSSLVKSDVISFGCGFSISAPSVLMYKSIMTELAILNKPVVLDADALNLL